MKTLFLGLYVISAGCFSFRSVCHVYYTLTSPHDPEDIQKRLEMAAPQFRFQMARRLQLGYTPELRFIPHQMNEYLFDKKRLFRLTHPPSPAVSSSLSPKRKSGRDSGGDSKVDVEALKHGWLKSFNGFP